MKLMPIIGNNLLHLFEYFSSGFVYVLANNSEQNDNIQSALCSCGLRYWKLQTSIPECFFLVSQVDNDNVCLDDIFNRIEDLSKLVDIIFILVQSKEITASLFFEMFTQSSITSEVQDTDFKLFFKSPSSSLEAQCFHINKQCWLT